MSDKPVKHEDSETIQIKGQTVFKLVIKRDRGGKIDHRAIYDINNDKVIVYYILDRDKGYDKSSIAERLEDI